MRTSVDIPDDLLEEARSVAAAEKTTMRSLLEEGLRWVLERRKRQQPFRLQDRSVAGDGVQPGIQEGDWEAIRDLIYRGRGT